MGYFISDGIGLTIAGLNTATFVTICYAFLKAVEKRSRLLHVLEKVYGPMLSPLRRILPTWRIDAAAIFFAVVLQFAAVLLKKHHQ